MTAPSAWSSSSRKTRSGSSPTAATASTSPALTSGWRLTPHALPAAATWVTALAAPPPPDPASAAPDHPPTRPHRSPGAAERANLRFLLVFIARILGEIAGGETCTYARESLGDSKRRKKTQLFLPACGNYGRSPSASFSFLKIDNSLIIYDIYPQLQWFYRIYFTSHFFPYF